MRTEIIPARMSEIPEKYHQPCSHQGTMVPLHYQTFESLHYALHNQRIEKTAWVYLPWNYHAGQKYSIVYLSHGGWSDETTQLGTLQHPSFLKTWIDHAVEDGLMKPVIIVCLTYNNTSARDSWDYNLAIKLTENYHNELVHDLMPAVESAYSTYAENTSMSGFRASRDHRAFAGFSMGGVNTWRTFEYCLDYFRYFSPMSGNLTSDGNAMAQIVRISRWKWNDFFILAASGGRDFARDAFVQQIRNMVRETDVFRYGSDEETSNLYYREWKNGSHEPYACALYTWNNLLWISKAMEEKE